VFSHKNVQFVCEPH